MKNAAVFSVSLLSLAIFCQPTDAQSRRGSRTTKTETTQSTSATVQTSRKPTGTRLSEQQKQNIATLEADLKAIKSGSQVTQAQKDALRASLTTLAEGSVKPDPVLVQNLATNLAEALADGTLSDSEKAQLAFDLQRVLNSANIPAEEVTAAIAAVQTILQASNIDRADVETIVNDLKAIADEARSNLPAPTKTESMTAPSQTKRRRN